MTFEVGRDTAQPKIQNDGMKYEGLRFRAQCRLAGRLHGQPFGVDVAFGDPILGEPETVTVDDELGFAGIAPPTVRLCRYLIAGWHGRMTSCGPHSKNSASPPRDFSIRLAGERGTWDPTKWVWKTHVNHSLEDIVLSNRRGDFK